MTDSANFAAEKTSLLNWDSTPVGTGTAADLGVGGLEAETAAGLVPTLGAAGVVIGLGAASIYTAWNISSGIQRLLNSTDAATAPVAGYVWWRVDTGVGDSTLCAGIGEATGCNFWELLYSTQTADPGPADPPAFTFGGTGTRNQIFCINGTDIHCNSTQQDSNVRALGTAMYAEGDSYKWFQGNSSQYVLVRSDAEMIPHIKTPPCNATCYSGATHKLDTTPTFTRGSTMTDTQLNSALCALGIGTGCAAAHGAPTTAPHKAQIDVLKKAVDPSYGNPVAPDCTGLALSVCLSDFSVAGFTATPTDSTATFEGANVTLPAETVIEQSPGANVTADPGASVTLTLNPAEEDMPFEIPRPYNYETYDDYIARLGALGYVGTITETDLSDETADTSVGPNGVPRIAVALGTGTDITTLNRSAWPGTAPRARRSVSIQIWKNPSDVPVPPPDPSDTVPNPDPGAGGGGGAGNCGPTVPSINLTPITGVDFGSKFPFGIFSYIATALSPLVASPSAPVFDVPIALMGNSYSLHVDFSAADPYMATIRLLMEIGIGITAVWLLAGSLLGFKAGGAGGGLDMDTSLGDD